MTIGYSNEDILFPVHPGVKRAVLEAVSGLKKLGHTLVEFPLPDASAVAKHYAGFIYADNFVGLSKLLDKDIIIDPAVSGCRNYASIVQNCPKVLLKAINRLLSAVYPKFMFQGTIQACFLNTRSNIYAFDISEKTEFLHFWN